MPEQNQLKSKREEDMSYPLHTSHPEWSKQLGVKFTSRVAQVFVLTGNTRDIVDNKNTLESYLTKMFTDRMRGPAVFDLVIYFDRASGLRFPIPEMGALFEREVFGNTQPRNQQTAGVFANAGQQQRALPHDPVQALAMVEMVLKKARTDEQGNPRRTLFIVDHAESIFPNGAWGSMYDGDRTNVVRLLNWAKDRDISDAANPIILITDMAHDLHDKITSSASRIEQIEILLPTPEERLDFIHFLDSMSKANGGAIQYGKNFNEHKFAALTAGLRKINIEDIRLTATKLKVPISADLVKKRKKEIFQSEYNSILEIIEPDYGFESVGGLEWLKDFHKFDVIEPMLEGDLKRVPQGLLYSGPPGTGKTWLAKALAKEAHMNMVNLNIGRLLGGIVGSSEANMEKAILAIRSLTPVLVFIDEIDQSINRGSTGDSGVSNRLFKRLLEFMSDTALRGRVLTIAATNRPDMMDKALKRRGRFDKRIPFLPPDEEQRAEIFKALFTKLEFKADKDVDVKALAKMTDGWTGADIEAALVKAYSLAKRDKTEVLTQEHLERAAGSLLSADEDTELWTKLALLTASDIDLIPPAMRDQFNKKALTKDIKTLQKESYTINSERHVVDDMEMN